MLKFSQLLRSILAATTSLRGDRSAKRMYPASVRRSTGMPHQGVQEMARRRQQIERGQLNMCNGLIRTGTDGTWSVDSHGSIRHRV